MTKYDRHVQCAGRGEGLTDGMTGMREMCFTVFPSVFAYKWLDCAWVGRLAWVGKKHNHYLPWNNESGHVMTVTMMTVMMTRQ